MVEHQLEHHPGVPSNFAMEVLSAHERPLERQVEEADLIGNFSGTLMNRRGEWGQNLPPRFTIGEDGQSKNKESFRKRNIQVQIPDRFPNEV